jgi:hypothetical protein
MVSCRLRATFLSITHNYKRVVTLQISINTAINYTTGYVLFIFYRFMKKLEWTTKKIKVADLIELEFNPRKISEEKRKKLIESLEKFNLVEIPAVNTDMKIIGGNQRVKALVIAGRGDELIDVRVPNRELTQKEVKEYNLISNSHAGEFDFDIIMSDFGDIDFSDIGLESPNDLFDKEIHIKKTIEIKPYKKSHILISFDINDYDKISQILEQLYKIKNIEIEQSAN